MVSRDIYLSAAVKAMDEGCGIDTEVLMENAASALYECLKLKNRLDGRICILCGKGNNGGDGYALGVLLLNSGLDVTVFTVDAPTAPLAIKYRDVYEQSNGRFCNSIQDALSTADTVVDCVFGFSFKGCLKGVYAEIARAVNESDAFVLAADVPSGITADSCTLPPICIEANLTCTFTALKPALASYPAAKLCGEIQVADIGIPEDTIKEQTVYATVADERLLKLIPKRLPDSHKGTFGTLAMLCGNTEMCGAAYLSCLSALKSGVGIVRLYTDEICAFITKTRLAEPIISTAVDTDTILSCRPTALLLGCGCGRSYDDVIKDLLLKADLPIVIDADGINCIAGDIQLYRSVKSQSVVTPHPAEMGRLAGISTAEVNADRIGCAMRFALEYGFVTVLKGAKTIVASPDGRLCISVAQNTGLSKGGSGDVLAGLIASLSAQGLNGFDAACLGVYLHSAAADRLANQKGVYSMLPSELPEIIGQIIYFG